jgi:hypothetical protein
MTKIFRKENLNEDRLGWFSCQSHGIAKKCIMNLKTLQSRNMRYLSNKQVLGTQRM